MPSIPRTISFFCVLEDSAPRDCRSQTARNTASSATAPSANIRLGICFIFSFFAQMLTATRTPGQEWPRATAGKSKFHASSGRSGLERSQHSIGSSADIPAPIMRIRNRKLSAIPVCNGAPGHRLQIQVLYHFHCEHPMSFRGFCWIRCLSRKVFASILLCTILFSSSGVLAQVASTSTERVFEEAQRAFDQGDFAAAVPGFEQVRRDAPTERMPGADWSYVTFAWATRPAAWNWPMRPLGAGQMTERRII